MYKNFASAHWRKLAMGLAAGVLLTGCAMTPNGRGGVLVGLDTAELFGTPISTFRLRDGTEGTLRKDPKGKYSIKLSQAFRVVPLDKAITARVARVENVGERTVVIVETQERGCAYRYEVLAFQGTDVLQWTVGNCKDRPRVELAADAKSLNIDFPNYNRLSRMIYTDNRLLNASVAVPPGVDTRAQPFADDALRATGPAIATMPGSDGGRVIPAPPAPASAPAPAAAPKAGSRASAKARRQDTPARAAAPAAISLPAPRAAAAAPAAPMIFQAEEIKPVVIDLRK
ncbi:hypothetical protein LSO07_02170 [Janthinobacterium sp. PLB04]|uniref:Lipoprotein n=1 Tax=Janthinobacterium lividum TaxID=29581 RepID=A0AAJ4MTD7_9BURK|nr:MULTISPECIES: hypothetical protein [Janthinobacterium]KAB0330603.1 hypothetical protein F3B38_02155 [Janthinobacterium lividum]MBR7633868.1 hypothetical protein [Janthinobacterium lividum]QSX96811.1 hypothetical protein J3P46_02165 [Janthinobacterium lividum]UGQ36711.1 hypothetical protein LSO07_02170 [Janthinobacterium sp. PLB04]